MTNIIKNSFIIFYKYLPILIPLSLILPAYDYYFPNKIYAPLSYFIILIAFITLSDIKNFSYFKTWKFWLIYTAFFLINKTLYNITEMFIFEILAKKILIEIVYIEINFVIFVALTLGYVNFRLLILDCAIINNEKITLKNLYNITNAPYWNIITHVFKIDFFPYLGVVYPPSDEHLFAFNLFSQIYSQCMQFCVATMFYKAKKAGAI